MMDKKIITFYWTILLLLSMNVCAQSTYGSTTGALGPTSLILNYDLTTIDKELEPGDTGTLTIVIQNTGGFEARDVKAWIIDTGNIKGGSMWNLGDINPGQSVTIKQTILIDNNAHIGTHILPLHLDYKSYWVDTSGRKNSKDQETNWEIPIKIHGDVEFVILDVNILSAGETSYLKITLRNIGKSKAKNIIATVIPQGDQIIPITSKANIATLDANKNGTLVFNVHIGESVTEGTYPINLRISYEDESGIKQESMLKTGVQITSGSIRIINVSTIPEDPEPGEKVEIKIDIKNVGSSSVKDIDVGFDFSDLPFSPKGSGSNIYVKSINIDEEKSIRLQIISDKNAEVKPYLLPLTVKYSSENNIKREDRRGSIGLVLKGKASLDIAKKTTDPISPKINEPFTLTMKIENTGTGNAKGVKTYLNCEGADDKEAYLGKIDKNDYGNGIFMITANSTGENKCMIKIDYEDDYGQHEIEKNFSIVVYEGGLNKSIFLIIPLAVMVIIGIVIIIRKRKKQSR